MLLREISASSPVRPFIMLLRPPRPPPPPPSGSLRRRPFSPSPPCFRLFLMLSPFPATIPSACQRAAHSTSSSPPSRSSSSPRSHHPRGDSTPSPRAPSCPRPMHLQVAVPRPTRNLRAHRTAPPTRRKKQTGYPCRTTRTRHASTVSSFGERNS